MDLNIVKMFILGARQMVHGFLTLVAFPETLVLFSAPTRWVTTVCNSSFKVSDAIFWHLWAPDIQVVHRPITRSDTHTHKMTLKQKNKWINKMSYNLGLEKRHSLHLAEDPSSVPGTHMKQLIDACNSSFKEPTSSDHLNHPFKCTYTQADPQIHNPKQNETLLAYCCGVVVVVVVSNSVWFLP